MRPAAESRRAILQDAERCLLRVLARDQAEHTGEGRIVMRQQAGLRRRFCGFTCCASYGFTCCAHQALRRGAPRQPVEGTAEALAA